MKLQKGQLAPALELFDSDKNKVNIAEYRGKNVVLLFFPLAFTSVCTAELCSVRDSLARYNELNAVVFGISVDSLYTLNRFRQEQALNFRLLSDFNKEASQAYGCLYELFSYNMKGVSKRSAFVIDGNGVVQYAEVLENAGEQPNFGAIQSTLKSIESIGHL